MDLNLPCYVPPNERARLIYQNGFCAKMRRIAARRVAAVMNAEKIDAVTGVTQSKQLVVLICEPKALGMAVRTQKSGRRVTNLVN